jgi:hypothetical protein
VKQTSLNIELNMMISEFYLNMSENSQINEILYHSPFSFEKLEDSESKIFFHFNYMQE